MARPAPPRSRSTSPPVWSRQPTARSTPRPGNTSTSRRANPTASRVLPDPPGPVNVTSRTPGEDSNAANSASSPSRPTSEVAGTGRLDAAPNDFTAANSVSQPGDVQLEQVLGRRRCPSTDVDPDHATRTVPSARSASTKRAVASDTTHLATMRRAGDPRRPMHIHPHIPAVMHHRGAGMNPHPDPHPTPQPASQTPPAPAAPEPPPPPPQCAVANTTKKLSPSVPSSVPPELGPGLTQDPPLPVQGVARTPDPDETATPSNPRCRRTPTTQSLTAALPSPHHGRNQHRSRRPTQEWPYDDRSVRD